MPTITSLSPSRSTLDEDSDIILTDRDEIFARVRLEPFMPQAAQASSNIVHGQLGARGDD